MVSYLVSTTPSGNVRVSTRLSFTQLSRAVKNGVPPPTRTGWVTITYSSISPARMAAAASVAPPMSMGPPSSALSLEISVTASPVTRRAVPSTVLGGGGGRGTADVHGAAVLGLEPGDLGDRVAGDQTGVPVDRAGRRGEHHLRHVPPAAGELDLRRCDARLLVGGRPVGAHRLPQLAPVQRQAGRPHPVGPPLEQLVARHAPAEVVAGRGDVAVQD